MLQFKKITLEDRDWITAYYKDKNFFSAKYSFGVNFVWREVFQLEMAEKNGFLFAKIQPEGYPPSFLCPVGQKDLPAAIKEIHAYCQEKGLQTRIHGIFDAEKEILSAAFGDRLALQEVRENFDYIYDREKLASLTGKKYHSKRNHIARFEDKDWRYEPLSKENLPHALTMHMEWVCLNEICREQIEKWQESCASIQALTWFDELAFTGGVLFQEDRVVAYTVGEPLTTDTFVVHFEKAFPDVQGAYPAINKQFVLHAMEGFTYVNREEDTGDEGLRKAKLSYHPEILLKEYWGILT